MAAVLDLTQSAATKIVQKFTGLGLVTVSRDKTDARNRPVSITPQGRAQLLAVQRSLGPTFEALTAAWNPDALRRLIADLETLSQGLERLRDEASGPARSER
jgi:DNA-binding MarR family transcriptional regulator